jgi:hypothetical protein
MKALDPKTQDVLQRALSNLVQGLSSVEKERILDEQATLLLVEAGRNTVNNAVKFSVNERREIDTIAAKYLHQSVFKYKF